MHGKIKKATALLLAVLMLLALCTGCEKKTEASDEKAEETKQQNVYELTDAAVTKDETVYVNITPEGEVQKVSVTDKLHTDMPQVRIEDKSNLDNISDVKTFIDPVYEGKHMYWDMDSTDLFYTGTTEQTPPMNVKVQYYLDGEEISYNKLAGKSGDVTIKISVTSELVKTVKLDGKKCTIECPMLFIGGMLLPEESFTDVATDNGVILDDGSRKLVCFMSIPGMNKSLGLDELGMSILGNSLGSSTYCLSCKAEDFALGNMMFVAVPFSSIRALGFDDISVSVDGMKAMLSDLEGLMNSFASLDIDELIQVLYGNAEQIETLVNTVADASELYEQNKALINVLNKYITDGNLDKLETVLNDMEKLDTDSIKSLSDYEPFSKLLKLIGKLDKNLGNLAQFTEDYLEIAPIFEDLNEDLQADEVKNAIDNLPETIKKLRSLVDVLRASEDLLNQTSKVLNSDTMEKIMSFADTVTTSESLNALTKAQSEKLAARMQAWLDYGESYDIFTQRTSSQTSSVVFVYKMDAIG